MSFYVIYAKENSSKWFLFTINSKLVRENEESYSAVMLCCSCMTALLVQNHKSMEAKFCIKQRQNKCFTSLPGGPLGPGSPGIPMGPFERNNK